MIKLVSIHYSYYCIFNIIRALCLLSIILMISSMHAMYILIMTYNIAKVQFIFCSAFIFSRSRPTGIININAKREKGKIIYNTIIAATAGCANPPLTGKTCRNLLMCTL